MSEDGMAATTGWRWTDIAPPLAAVIVAVSLVVSLPTWVVVATIPFLVAAILAAVEHAEAIGHRLGEPFGSLVLAVAVTVIEVGLIVALMSSGKDDAATLARDTVFAAIMICCNGIVGITLIAGTRRGDGVTSFNAEGCRAGLATVVMLATLTLVLPSFTQSASGPRFTAFQLAFAAAASLSLWALYVFTQTVRHRYFFVDEDVPDTGVMDHLPTNRSMPTNLVLLGLALIGVIGLAKLESPLIERAVVDAELPHALVGVIIATVVLLPEALTAVRAASAGEQQRAFNLAYGSAIATIGLTIPVLAVLSPLLPVGLHLGLEPVHVVLLFATFVLGTLTIVPGQATRLQGGVHVVLFAAFVALTISP